LHLLTSIEPLNLFNTDEGEWNWRSHLQDNEIDYELSHVLDKLVEGATNRRFQSVAEVERALAGEVRPLVRTPPARSRHNYSSRKNTRNRARNTGKQASGKSLPRHRGKLDLKILEFQYSKIDNDPCVIMGKTVSLTTNRYGGKAKYITLQLGHEITIDLIGIPGGKFLMGSLESESEREIEESPQHAVSVRPFLMGKYPITQAQWLAVMDDNPSRFIDSDSRRSKKPVERVSWHDCDLFCQKLSELVGRDIRLPSEAEWEYACRGKTKTPFHCGSTISTELANYNGEEIYRSGIEGENRQQTTDVDTFTANPFGLYDLHGNVAEWCADTWHNNYQNAPADGSPWVSNNPKDQRVLRGGSWLHLPGSCRSAQRLKSAPQSKSDAFGFRIAASI
ncbi:MAG: formylglycine-generating enzyme family protein, partial [Cyanobacteria bacterium P01_C01_bin.72]